MATTVKCVLRQYFEDFNKAAAALEKAKGKKREKKVAARLEYLARKEQRNHLLCFDINLHWPVWSFADISDRYQKDHIVCFNLAPDPKSGETRITTSKFEYVLGFQKISAEMPAIKLNEDITNVDPEAAAYLRAMLAEYLDEPAGAGDDPEAEAVEAKAAEDEAAEADQEEEEEAAVALEAQEDSSTEAESSTDMPDTDSDDDDMLKLLRLPFDWMGMMERGRAGTLSRGGPHGGLKRARERYVRTYHKPKNRPFRPKRPPEGPRRLPKGPKRPPRGLREAPRGPQGVPKRPNRGPTEAQQRPQHSRPCLPEAPDYPGTVAGWAEGQYVDPPPSAMVRFPRRDKGAGVMERGIAALRQKANEEKMSAKKLCLKLPAMVERMTKGMALCWGFGGDVVAKAVDGTIVKVPKETLIAADVPYDLPPFSRLFQRSFQNGVERWRAYYRDPEKKVLRVRPYDNHTDIRGEPMYVRTLIVRT